MRHTLLLYQHYKTAQNFFNENNIDISREDIHNIEQEFLSSKTLRKFKLDSEKFFDYIINRFHILGRYDQYHYCIPLEYKNHKAIYRYDENYDMYIGFVENEYDSSIEGKTLEKLYVYFKNTVDFVISTR